MKLAVVTQFPIDPNKPHGGVEAVSVNLVQGLARQNDLDVHVVTMNVECDRPAQSDWKGATIHRLPHVGKKMLTSAIGPGRRSVSQYVTKLNPDVIHAHDTYGLMVKGLSTPRVFTIHGFIYGDTLVNRGRFAWLRSQIWKRVETAGWADQPHIISISPYVRERLTGIATGIIHDIDNPIAESFFHIPRNEQKGNIFSAALISQRKNTLTLVDAFARMLKSGVTGRLRLAGTAVDSRYDAKVKQLIQSKGIADRVDLLGAISSDQVRQELAAASIFALASLEENSPMGIEEAMAARVPVVTSNRCGMPYMVRDGETGYLIDPHDPGDIAWRFQQLLQDDRLRARMGERSHQVAQDRFHPETVARRTCEVYCRAMRSAAPNNHNR
jgi:glycosyltransferase involved in cell wall biosynthesis